MEGSGTTTAGRRNTDYEALVRGHFDVCLNGGRWERASEFYTPDLIVHHPALGDEPVHGIEGFKDMVETARQGFSDMRWEVVDVFGSRDGDQEKIADRLRVTGTHDGDFLGFPPSGNRFDVEEMTIGHLQDGRLREVWVIPDLTSQMRQLGLIPDGPPPKLMLKMMKVMQRFQRS